MSSFFHYVWVFCLHVCVPCVCVVSLEAKGGIRFFGNEVNRWLWVTMWGTEPKSSKEQPMLLNHWTISPSRLGFWNFNSPCWIYRPTWGDTLILTLSSHWHRMSFICFPFFVFKKAFITHAKIMLYFIIVLFNTSLWLTHLIEQIFYQFINKL